MLAALAMLATERMVKAMFDSGKVIIGLAIFLILVTAPLWYGAISGRGGEVPELVKPEGQCILDAVTMRASHMDLLNEWRDRVVRDGERIYTTPDDKQYVMSLQNTCMSCHSNKAEFCDQCHDYMGVTPYCWTCHVEPVSMPPANRMGGQL